MHAQLKAQSTRELLRARWCEPALSVVDVRVGDDEQGATDPFYRFGPTRFSVIPRSAVGNVSVRFVPDQVPPFLPSRSQDHVQYWAPSNSPSSPGLLSECLCTDSSEASKFTSN